MRMWILGAGVIAVQLVVGLGNPARSEEVREDSLEWLVADSDLIVRGTIRAMRTEDKVRGEATIAVDETLNGKAQDEWTFAAQVLGWPADLVDKREPVLAFVKGRELKQVLSLAEVAKGDRKRVWHASSFRRSAVTMECRVLWTAADKLHAVREAVEAGADVLSPTSTIVSVEPLGPSQEAFKLLWSGSGVGLTIPFDPRLTDKSAPAAAQPDREPAPAEVTINNTMPPFGEDILVPVASREAPAKDKGLVLEVEFERREYLLGEPILVRCSLANYSRAPITIAFDRWGEWCTLEFKLGKRVPRLPRARDSFGPVPRTIPAGWRLVELYNLLDEYQITEAGEYTANVQYESDGKSFRGEGHWKGKLEQSLGTIAVVTPERPEDKAALDWLMENGPRGRRAGHYDYLYSADDTPRLDEFLELHGNSRYAAYARYGDGVAALLRAKRASGGADVIRRAIARLSRIDTKGYPPLFAERALFHLLEAQKLAEAKPDETKKAVEEFVRAYPDSSFVPLVKGVGP